MLPKHFLLREVEPPGGPRGWSDFALRAVHSEVALVVLTHLDTVTSAAFSPDGARIVTASKDKTARVWTDFTPLVSADDPRLWLATRYCLSIARRTQLLSVSEATARADQAACERRMEAARGSH